MDINLNGFWQNKHDSEMNLKIDGENITGTFQTKIGVPNFEEKFEVIGRLKDNLIAFIVDFSKYGSLGCWTGQIEIDDIGVVIHSMYHLSQTDGKSEDKVPKAILTGVGTFRKP